VDVDDDILIRETSGWLDIVSILVWRKDCKGRKSRGDDSDIRMQRASFKYLYRIRLTTRHRNLPLTSILFAV
jgi:hypothetical protein